MGHALRRMMRITLLCALVATATVTFPFESRADHAGLTLNVTPESDRNLLRDTHELTATISQPPPQARALEVHFEIVSGPNRFFEDERANDTPADFTNPDLTCTILTNETSCKVPYSDEGAPQLGTTDKIVAWIDHDPAIAETSLDGLDQEESQDAGEPPHEPGVRNGSAGDLPEPDGTDVVIKHWGQLQVGHGPFIDGPDEALVFLDSACNSIRRRTEGLIVVRARACHFLYAHNPSMEEDAEFNHYVMWAQARAYTTRRWCATKLAIKVKGDVAEDSTAMAGPRRGPVERAGDIVTRMRPDAGGFAFEESYMDASGLYYKGRIGRRSRDGSTTFSWRGRTRRTVGMPVGVEFKAVPQDQIAISDPTDIIVRAEKGRC